MKPAQPYWWFQGASVTELIAELTAAGPNPRLEVRVDHQKRMTLLVVPEGDVTTQSHTVINESHICPPDCG